MTIASGMSGKVVLDRISDESMKIGIFLLLDYALVAVAPTNLSEQFPSCRHTLCTNPLR
jgi:hypothetical protein